MSFLPGGRSVPIVRSLAVTTLRNIAVGAVVATASLMTACRPQPEISSVIAAEAPDGAVDARVLAATVPWTDPRRSLSRATLVTDPSVVVGPLDDAALPRKILAVDGRRPGDPGYPLVEWTVARHPRTGRSWASADAPLSVPDPPPIHTVAAVGDIMPGRGFGALLIGPDGVNEALGDVAPLLAGADLLIGNLETAVTESTAAVTKSYNFKVSETVLRAVVDLGFDVFHLANNHGWDYGEGGFLDTLEALRRSGVGFSGAGIDLDAAAFPWETVLRDPTAGRGGTGETPVRIVSLGAYERERNGFDGSVSAAAGPGKPGVLWDRPENEERIRALLNSDDFTIVTVHGGYEWEQAPRSDVRERYRRYVDWGADLVLAHHPHVLQGMELYRESLIAYSLGNFIFPGMTGWYTGEETGILEIGLLEGRIVSVDFRPVRIAGTRLRRAEGEGIDERFWEMTRDLAEPDEATSAQNLAGSG